MKQFVVGRTGTQKFPIGEKYNRVSGNHVKILITDDDEWWIEDLNSTNGTFVQDEMGDFQRVSKKKIDEFSRVALGGTSIGCFVFTAHHLLEDYSDNPEEEADNYCAEFIHMLEIYEEIAEERKALEAKQKRKTKVKMIPPVVTGLVGMTVIMLGFKDWLTYVTYTLTQIGTLALLIQDLMSPAKEDIANAINSKLKRLCVCPHCGLPLDSDEISLQSCSHCKAHA